MRRLLTLAAAMAALLLTATPALACGGLVGPNGAVNLLRTTTFAGYHDGVEHYVTSFEFAGGEGEFGSIVPLPGVPTDVVRGGDWTLQRLVQETDAGPAEADAFSRWPLRRGCEVAPRSCSRRRSTRSRSPSCAAAATRLACGPPTTASGCRPMRPRCSTSTPIARRSSWPLASTPMPPASAARPWATGRPCT